MGSRGVGSFKILSIKLWPMKSNEVTTLWMHIHLRTFKFIQFFPDCCLVFGCKSGPWFISSTVVLLRLRHFHIVTEANDLKQHKKEQGENGYKLMHARWPPFPVAVTFFSFKSSMVGRKLNFRSNIFFFSSFKFRSSSVVCSGKIKQKYWVSDSSRFQLGFLF